MRHFRLWIGGLMALAPFAALAGDGPISALNAYAEAPAGVNIEILSDDEVVISDSGQDVATGVENLVLQLAAPDGTYWIGLDCEPAGDALRSQLGLDENIGLAVLATADDSPAEAAGLQAGDVVTVAKLNGKVHPLASAEQFAEMIQAAETNPIELTIIRKGKSQSLTVTPAARPGIAVVKHEKEKGKKTAAKPRELKTKLDGEKATVKKDKKDMPGRRQQAGQHRHSAKRGEGHRGEWRGKVHPGRDRHHRHMAQRGAHRHFGRMAMLRHGRSSGFGHGGFRHGSLFARRFAMLHHHGLHMRRTTDAGRPSPDIVQRLESLVERLEKLVGSQGPARIGSAGAGGFRPQFMGRRPDGERPDFHRFGQRRDSERSDSPRREASADGPSLDQVRTQLKQLQEQQERMMHAMRNLAEAVEKLSSRK